MKHKAFLIIFLSSLCSLSYGKICFGTNNGHSRSHQREQLRRVQRFFSNCTKVVGNLEIVALPSDPNIDLSFLHDIREVTGYVLIHDIHARSLPLPMLRLIRGRNLYSFNITDPKTNKKKAVNFSLKITRNRGLVELGLNSLIEISAGDVVINSNKASLCDKVLWNDTLKDVKSQVFKDPISSSCSCHATCPKFKEDQYCWGPREPQCQKLTKLICHGSCTGRCFGSDPGQCCSETCAAGCKGNSNKECFACGTYIDDDSCVNFCPPLFIMDNDTSLVKPNPKGKYAHKYLCVSKCPAYVYEDKDRGECVTHCKEGQTGVDGVCKPCKGPCPKSCNGTGSTFLSNFNIGSFKNCVVIKGSLRISDTTFKKEYDYVPLTYKDLTILETVTLIEGSLLADANSSSFTNMSFHRNLKIVRGNQPTATKYGLYIYKSSLEFLGLDSLENVFYGRLVITLNPNLCLVNTTDWMKIIKYIEPTYEPAIFIQDNRDNKKCAPKNKICHKECDDSGCSGPLDSDCLKCRNYIQGNRCVPSCKMGRIDDKSGKGSKVCIVDKQKSAIALANTIQSKVGMMAGLVAGIIFLCSSSSLFLC